MMNNEEILTKSNSILWSNQIEQTIKEIGEKSKGYKIMHIQEARKISKRYRLLMYAGISLGPLAGLLSSLGTVLGNASNIPFGFTIASTCIGFISGIVIAITKYGKFEEKSSHHKIAASKYTSLESNVKRQLVLSREYRINAVQYLDYVGSSFDELFMSSPLITNSIYQKYVKIAKKNNIIVPDEYGLTINLNENYQNNKLDELKNVSVICIDGIDNNHIRRNKEDERAMEAIIWCLVCWRSWQHDIYSRGYRTPNFNLRSLSDKIHM